uniref:Lipopolysaccharide transport system ATP-binding protein n=1 Tax=uncultured Bacteroidota bacterium TaxID=152509 RepID=H5SMQ5_9BACT|nr:lipopolysaccharide transport system ATP-binding protein [uncultured Bacteroidetes bacterium]
MSKPIIELHKLGKRYRKRTRESYLALRDILAQPWRLWQKKRPVYFWALKEVTFAVQPGEVWGVIGRNGAGKSTLLKILSRITEPTEGYAILRGRVGSLLEIGTGFHYELTGRENIYFNGALLGMKRAEIRRKFDEIVEFSGVGEFLDMPLKHYSSGMVVRLGFAIAAHLEPEILIVDEVLAVGDIEFQKKCLGKMEEVSSREGRTVLFVSHQMNQIRRLCQKAVWLEEGQVRQVGPVEEVLSAYEVEFSRRSKGEEFLLQNGSSHVRARFLRWELRGSSEEEAYSLSHFGPLTVAFLLHVFRPLRYVYIMVAIRDMEGRVLWGIDRRVPALSPGIVTFEYELEYLPLAPGTYEWTAHLHDEEGLVDILEGYPLLRVDLPMYRCSLDQWAGILNIPYTFRVSTVEAG